MGIKEPPSIKTKAVTRQSSKLAYVIVWRRLRGCLCLLSKAIALPDWIGLSFNVELDLDSRISERIPGFLVCGFIGQPVQLSNLMMKNWDNLFFLQEPLFITSCRALAPPCGVSLFFILYVLFGTSM